MRRTGAVLSIIGIVSMGFAIIPILHSLSLARAEQTSSSKSIPITISMSGFQPSSIQVPVDRQVSLEFVNPDNQYHSDGGGWHQWENDKLGINVMVSPQSTKTVNITFKKRGTYDFVCTVCCGGATNPYMHEKVTVI